MLAYPQFTTHLSIYTHDDAQLLFIKIKIFRLWKFIPSFLLHIFSKWVGGCFIIHYFEYILMSLLQQLLTNSYHRFKLEIHDHMLPKYNTWITFWSSSCFTKRIRCLVKNVKSLSYWDRQCQYFHYYSFTMHPTSRKSF